jgi:hypothetical protein
VPAPVVVLDTMGFWRIHQTVKPPVAQVDDEIKPFLNGGPWTEWETEPPPSDWTKPDFDDYGWVRAMARMTGYSPYLARVCLRGKFAVADPARAQGLRLSVSFHGGAVTYVNGQEVGRSHVAPGSDLADPYPPEAFLGKDGGLAPRVGIWNARRIERGDSLREMRCRVLDNVEVPSGLLRAGVNVVAVEIVRAPYSKDVYEYKPKENDTRFRWPPCMLYGVQLTAVSPEGLTPNAFRPQEFQVWNQSLLASDFVVDWGDRTERLRPIEIVGVRNGAFSGKVMVGSAKPIRQLKVTPGDLTGPNGVIPAAQVQIRYALPWGDNYFLRSLSSMGYVDDELGCLSELAPDEIPLSKSKTERSLLDGAVTAVWVTVKVPGDAMPGAYSGSVTVAAEGEEPVAAPLELKVVDWTLSNPQDYKTWVEIMQSPDTLAAEYEIPLWSDRHWELIARSFRLMRNSGSRIVYVSLIAETNQGHSETMVRWIRKGDNQYEYDFSVMDKYLDVAEENLGPLKAVVFWTWEVYMIQKEQFSGREYQRQYMEGKDLFTGKGPVVSVLDRATGKIENAVLPRYQEPESKALWKPLFDQLRERMSKRGLGKKMLLGMINDACPTKDELDFFAEVAPGLPWTVHAHGVYGKAQVGYKAVVWSPKTPQEKSLMGWKRPDLSALFNRDPEVGNCEPAEWRTMGAFTITSDQGGIGRLGGDFWKVFKDKKGQRSERVYARYPKSNWRNLDIYTALLAPLPEGAAVTTRYEHLREGLQECEARIAIERALSDEALKGKLDADLVARCEKALEEHLRALQLCRGAGQVRISPPSARAALESYWFLGSGWEGRAEKLFTLAGEVEKKVGREP